MKKFAMSCCLAVSIVLPSARADTIFEFHSNLWVNLHHFLLEQATVKSPVPSDSPQWEKALDYYRREVIKQDVLSREAEEINNRLSDQEGAVSLTDSGLPRDLIAALKAAAPVYKARWWPEHNHANHLWMETVSPLIAKYGEALKKELATIYQTEWPAAPIRTDVAVYANWSGAYTTLEPTHITVSSVQGSNQGDAALEILFHEASHAMFLKIRDGLLAEATTQKKLFRRREFWHAVLFYSAGEMVRRHIGPQINGYNPYAIKNGVLDRGWPGALEVLDSDWKPYLDGKTDLATAIHRLVADYGVAQ